jgi:hypothetical protein
MRRPSDYWIEMLQTKISDREIERILSGETTATGEFDDLVPIVEMLRDQGGRSVSDTAASRFAAGAAALVRTGQTAPTAAPSSRRRNSLALTPRLAAALVVIVLVVGSSGVAMAADSAIPGDALYGLDLALENIGIGAGQIDERLDEAGVLVENGHAQQALQHAAQSLVQADLSAGDLSVEDLASALETAADTLEEPDDDIGAPTNAKVAALLTYLRENIGDGVGADGKEFGQGVAELARGISVSNDQGQNSDDPSQDTTDQPEPSDGVPGQGQGSPPVTPGTGGDPPGGGQGNSGNPPGTGQGNSGDPPGDGQGNSGDPPGGGQGNDNSGDNGVGNGNGNGPPDSSPSDTAPGRGNKP